MSKVNTYRISSEYNSSADTDVIWLDNQDTAKSYIHLHYVHTYNCGKKSHKYNGMSMLWLNGGVKAVKVLMQKVVDIGALLKDAVAGQESMAT